MSQKASKYLQHLPILYILEIALLNTQIDIKVTNLVEVHLNELEELRLKQDKRRNTFTYLETDLSVPLHLQCKVYK